jgi:type IV secretory pathway VirB4 component
VFIDMANDKAKTGRKREVALMLATQFARDALSRHRAGAISAHNAQSERS